MVAHPFPPASAGRKPCSRRVPVHPLSTPPRLFPSYRLRLYFPAGLSAPPIVRIRPVFSPGECPAVCKRKKTARELPRAAVLRRFARLLELPCAFREKRIANVIGMAVKPFDALRIPYGAPRAEGGGRLPRSNRRRAN